MNLKTHTAYPELFERANNVIEVHLVNAVGTRVETEFVVDATLVGSKKKAAKFIADNQSKYLRG